MITEYEYDAYDQLVRTISVSEPRFTEQDRAELIALTVYRENLCGRCGRPLEVCTSHEETGPQFAASYTVCRSTLALIEAQRGKYGEKDHPNRGAHLWGTTMRR